MPRAMDRLFLCLKRHCMERGKKGALEALLPGSKLEAESCLFKLLMLSKSAITRWKQMAEIGFLIRMSSFPKSKRHQQKREMNKNCTVACKIMVVYRKNIFWIRPKYLRSYSVTTLMSP